MNKNTSIGLLGAGVLVIIAGLIAHFALHGKVFPHFSLVLGVVAIVLLALGGWGYTRQSAA